MNYIIDSSKGNNLFLADGFANITTIHKVLTHYWFESIKRWKNNWFLPLLPMLIVLLHTRSRLFFICSKRPASRLAGMRLKKVKKSCSRVCNSTISMVFELKTHYVFILLMNWYNRWFEIYSMDPWSTKKTNYRITNLYPHILISL